MVVITLGKPLRDELCISIGNHVYHQLGKQHLNTIVGDQRRILIGISNAIYNHLRENKSK